MIIRLIRSLLFYSMLVVTFIIGTTLTVFFSPFAKQKTKPFQTSAHLWARLLVLASGVKTKISGLKNIPRDKALIFASNHQGAADVLLALAFLPIGFRFAIKKELFRVPFFGWYLKRAGYFSIDRKLVLSAYKTVEQIIDIIKAGESVLIFPEGTRTRTGELGKFKRGSLLAALKSGAPIMPIAISGSFNIMPKGSWIINPCPVKFSVGQPIEIKSEEDYDKKIAEVRQAIAGML
ncbi:lysophospholipid acyltransferase family protein [Candidatus Margulisiibacteriota bacterium]